MNKSVGYAVMSACCSALAAGFFYDAGALGMSVASGGVGLISLGTSLLMYLRPVSQVNR